MSRTRPLSSGLKLGGALVALTAFANPALAQGTQTDASADDGTITVTARRRAESLQNVPIAISAYSGDQLEREGALDITDIGDTTPNVTIEASRGTNSTLTAFIRGVGQQDPVGGFEAGVGIYLDDVYLNRPQAALLDIYDVERIEILRGPQGTLYGRNTIGGAIKYVTRRLSGDPTLRFRGTVGTYDQADLVVSASTPLAAEGGGNALRVGTSLARLSRGGFGDNLTTGRENYNRDIWAGRLSVEYNNENDIFIRLQGDYTRDNSETRGGHRLIPGLISGTPVLADVYDSRGGLLDPEQLIRAWGVSLFAEFQPAEYWTLRSITAFRRDRSFTPIDFDALPAVDVDVPGFYGNQQTSQELQILYNRGGLNGLFGAYYLDANSDTIFDVRLPGGLAALTFGDVSTETFAIFGDFSYDFSPQWSVSLGGRYTWDERSSVIDRGVYLGGGGSPFFGGTGVRIANQSSFNGTATFEEFTPRASISFRPNQDNTIYASYSRGFKGGGFDPRGVTTACRDPQGNLCDPAELFDFMSFDPETVSSYELGWRAQLFDRRLRLNVTAFHADYTDVQIPGSIGTVLNGIPSFVGITTNAGRARFQGLEIEGNASWRGFAASGDSLNFGFSLGYITRFLEYIDARGIDVSDNRRIQNTPAWTASGTLNYAVPAFGGTFNFMTTLPIAATRSIRAGGPPDRSAGLRIVGCGVTWRSDDNRWSIGLHGRNLTAKQYITSGYNFLRQNPDTARSPSSTASRASARHWAPRAC